ncbi:hypothetical protein C1H46_042950 [Malus baccata]|uniref:Uncharacterized protein n=1 Tax=Malus baccata TaxID=106549 RepID=A0A540KBB9_MALBA|nr:hypothetical protein C1H46_042950 [Malus baccata]
MAELQSQRSTTSSELEKDFEVNKPMLVEYAVGAKRIQALKVNKRIRQANITMGEVKWLELKSAFEAFLLSTP